MQFPIRLTVRSEPSKTMRWLSPVAALVLTVLVGAALFAFLGKDPMSSLYVFLVAPLENLRGWCEVGVKMTPLLLCAAGLTLCYRANIWNIGAEGQLVMGAVAGTWAALQCPPDAGMWYLVPVLLAGVAGGALWGGLTALLKDKFNANEILVSLMLVYVAQFFLAWCLQGPMQDPDGFGFPQSPLFEAAASVPTIPGFYRLGWGFVMAVVLALKGALLMSRFFIGFQIRVSGMAPLAAKYAGFNPSRLIWTVMLISGGCAGLAGICEAAGPVGQLTLNISPGYGFAAIIVAFAGRLSPVGCIPAAFVLALFYLGGELGQSRLGLPSSITGVYQGLLLFFLLICDVGVLYRLKWVGFANKGTTK